MSEWKKLKDSHRSAVNRIRTTTGQAAKKIKKWKYEDEMQFVLKTMCHRPSNTNVLLEDLNEDEEHLSADAPQQEITLRDTGEESDVDSDDHLRSETNEVESTKKADHGTPKERRHRPPRGVDKILGFMKEKEKRKHTKPQPDELDHFFASAAQSIRKLPRLLQIKLKRDITNMICQAEEQFEWERNQSTPYLSHTTTPTISPSYSSSTSRRSPVGSQPTPQPQQLELLHFQQPNHFAASQWSYNTTPDSRGQPQELSPGNKQDSFLSQTGYLCRNARDQCQ